MQLHEEAGAVRRDLVLPVDREAAWEAVTDPAWLGDELDQRAAVEEEREERRRIAFAWDGLDGGRSLVEITLDDAAEGWTRVTVVEIPLVTLRAVGAEVAAAGGGGAPQMLACV